MGASAVETIVAFLDLGTNSVRLLVVRLNPNCSYTVLTQQKEPIRLGEGEFTDDFLTAVAMDRAVSVCGRLTGLARGFGAEEIIAVATSATRDARNRSPFIHRLTEEAGVAVRVVSGEEEARLIYRGVASGIELGERTALFIDIGGGSTEVIVGSRENHHFLKSLKLGAIRLTNQFFPAGVERPVEPERFSELCHHIRSNQIHAVQGVRAKGFDLAVGSSGTIENLQQIAWALYHAGEEECGMPVLSRTDLERLTKTLCILPLAERQRLPGINPERADIIIAGAAILQTFMEELAIPEILVSNRSLRDGLLMDYLSRQPGFPHARETSPRRRSVTQLGRACHIDEAHAETVSRLSLALFDSAAAAGLHTLGPAERELLGHAAFLHDVGQFISFSGHHIHSRYIIAHAPLLGFDQNEVAVIAEVCRYHRKKIPKQKDRALSAFDDEDRMVIRVLSTLLRIAEHLDRSHTASVRDALFRQETGDGAVHLLLTCRGDCSLEVWAVEGDRKAFCKAFGRDLVVQVSEDDD